jgi:predicted metalloprotease with PDZ domain
MLAAITTGSIAHRYTVRFPAPATHYVEVEASFSIDGESPLELFMAVWTPGSYLVREYARNVENLAVFDATGAPVAVRKTRKNRWLAETQGSTAATVRYRVYCRELSVRTNWVDGRFALLQGAATFVSVPGQLDRINEVTLVLPPHWTAAFSGLPSTIGTAGCTFTARDYETLVDSPILAGNPAVYEFSVDGKKHYLVNEGEDGLWDGPRTVADLERIVRENLRFWGALPYDSYHFLNVIGNGYGGLEHKNSCCLLSSRYATRSRENYIPWLELACHEFFHVWNVKRLRPKELGPFDYENENYTAGLWVAEGFTEYYGELVLRRAGLISPDEYLGGNGSGSYGLSKLIEKLQTTPGRMKQSVELSSFDAWIKLYRPDENSINSTISYYTKGAVIAFLLDWRIREATAGAKTLDHVIQLSFEKYSGGLGFSSGDFRQIIQAVAGLDLSEFLNRLLETTEELDYAGALAWFGLRFKKSEPPKPGAPKSWLGFTTKIDAGQLVVKEVPWGTPAFDAGISADDEIIAIGEHRVRADQWSQRLEQYGPGERISLLLARQERLVQAEATLGEDPGKRWTLEMVPDATAEQIRRRNDWLGIRD